MRSKVTANFRKLLRGLPPDVRKAAISAYRRWKSDPFDSSLEFEEMKIGPNRSLWSARVTTGYRILGGFESDDVIVWGRIGTHNEYDKLTEPRRARRGGISQ